MIVCDFVLSNFSTFSIFSIFSTFRLFRFAKVRLARYESQALEIRISTKKSIQFLSSKKKGSSVSERGVLCLIYLCQYALCVMF